MPIMRLDRLVASQLYGVSRNDVKKLCLNKKISVNGKLVPRSDAKVSTDDEIFVDGRRLIYKEHIYIMLNKPAGVVCSTRDGVSETVLELVPESLMREGLFPAGRLDKDTEGFVLLTDDGALAHSMLSPKSHVVKTYELRLEKPWEESYAQAFTSGMTIPPERAGEQPEKCLPAEFSGSSEDRFSAVIRLREGKYHQIKRMIAALDNKVVYLRRTAIGGLTLDPELGLGECLEIMHKDVESLLTQKQP
ncbi:MAG: rRNA pseudouridine synthase [Ruminococcus sp.]|nr:rRNA pseudouridine synthase [Ruminococcus sp.]